MEENINHLTEPVTFDTETVTVSRKELIEFYQAKSGEVREEAAPYAASGEGFGQYLMPAARLLADLYLKSREKEADAQ